MVMINNTYLSLKYAFQNATAYNIGACILTQFEMRPDLIGSW